MRLSGWRDLSTGHNRCVSSTRRIVLLALMAGLLAGCGGAETAASPPFQVIYDHHCVPTGSRDSAHSARRRRQSLRDERRR